MHFAAAQAKATRTGWVGRLLVGKASQVKSPGGRRRKRKAANRTWNIYVRLRRTSKVAEVELNHQPRVFYLLTPIPSRLTGYLIAYRQACRIQATGRQTESVSPPQPMRWNERWRRRRKIGQVISSIKIPSKAFHYRSTGGEGKVDRRGGVGKDAEVVKRSRFLGLSFFELHCICCKFLGGIAFYRHPQSGVS